MWLDATVETKWDEMFKVANYPAVVVLVYINN